MRQGSRSIPTPAPVHSHQSSNGYTMDAIDRAWPQPTSQEAVPTSDVSLSKEAQAESAAPHSTRAGARSAAPSSHLPGEVTADLHAQPERTATSDSPASQPQTGTGTRLQQPESPDTAAQASNEGEAAGESISLDIQNIALQTRDISRTVHALEPSQEVQGESHPGDWREQQQRWFETPSGLAEAAGLHIGPDDHTSTVPAPRTQSEVGPDDRLLSLGNQPRHPQNPIKVSRSSIPWSGLGARERMPVKGSL